MPLYEYQCRKCGHRFEEIQKVGAKPIRKCPKCKGPVDKLLSAPAVQFKGSGWYVTDYARKGSGDPSAKSDKGESKDTGGGKKDSSDSGGAKEGPKGESKKTSKE